MNGRKNVFAFLLCLALAINTVGTVLADTTVHNDCTIRVRPN